MTKLNWKDGREARSRRRRPCANLTRHAPPVTPFDIRSPQGAINRRYMSYAIIGFGKIGQAPDPAAPTYAR